MTSAYSASSLDGRERGFYILRTGKRYSAGKTYVGEPAAGNVCFGSDASGKCELDPLPGGAVAIFHTHPTIMYPSGLTMGFPGQSGSDLALSRALGIPSIMIERDRYDVFIPGTEERFARLRPPAPMPTLPYNHR
jgi:hypothetical protein